MNKIKKIHEQNKFINYIIAPLIIFVFAYLLRIFFFSGFILCDDAQEFPLIVHLLDHSPNFNDPVNVRFTLWLFNLIFFKLFDVSEFTFFLPTLIMSSSISVIGYFILYSRGHKVSHSFLAALFIASVPFEVLMGTLRANDLIFSWLLALSILFLFIFEKKEVTQGVLIAFLMWLAFYIKVWVVYLFPALFCYYLFKFLREKRYWGLVSFSITSFFLHFITSIYWKIKINQFLPFLSKYSATYPVQIDYLKTLWAIYPKLLFKGSEFGTTLFGIIPYILILLLLLRVFLIILSVKKSPNPLSKLDRLDYTLIVYYTSFFLLLNFFPNTFKFDQYYSVPRIFRYLASLSFPMTLHVAKLLIDITRHLTDSTLIRKAIKIKTDVLLIILVMGLIFVNIYQTEEATRPGTIYHKNLLAIINDLKKESPPSVISESWLSFFLKNVYLKDTGIDIITVNQVYKAKDYEKWLNKTQNTFKPGTMLITGLGGCVHYGAHYDGFKLNYFDRSLNPEWILFREYRLLSYLPSPEVARLWVLSDVQKEIE